MTKNKARLKRCDELLASAGVDEWTLMSEKFAREAFIAWERMHWVAANRILDSILMSEACLVGDLGPEDIE